MPIKPENRGFYLIDWPQLSQAIRFGRALGRCEKCGVPHKTVVYHLGDGRWWDAENRRWVGGKVTGPDMVHLRRTYIVLATAHRDHDEGNSSPKNLAAWCQACHIRHDAPEHARRRRITYLLRKALGDLFLGPYRV